MFLQKTSVKFLILLFFSGFFSSAFSWISSFLFWLCFIYLSFSSIFCFQSIFSIFLRSSFLHLTWSPLFSKQAAVGPHGTTNSSSQYITAPLKSVTLHYRLPIYPQSLFLTLDNCKHFVFHINLNAKWVTIKGWTECVNPSFYINLYVNRMFVFLHSSPFAFTKWLTDQGMNINYTVV